MRLKVQKHQEMLTKVGQRFGCCVLSPRVDSWIMGCIRLLMAYGLTMKNDTQFMIIRYT